jgi:putative DNA primase/helicase
VDRIGGPFADKSTSDPARACFLSWDPDLYVNDDAEMFIPPSTLDPLADIPEEEFGEITRRVFARLFDTPARPAKLLDALLEQVEKVDFRERAGLTDEADKLGRKHFLVCAVEEVLSKARANCWDLCKNTAFIYVFNGAYWETVEKEELQTFLGEAAERMGVEPRADVVLVNLQNGTFEIGAKQQRLRPASSGDFLTYQLPFDYDPKATAPTFQAFLDRVQPDMDRQFILAECVAYLFVNPATLKLEKVPLLYGTGANGKSVFFDVVNALLGGGTNVSSFTLQQLTDENGYYRAKLANKLVNYASEINGKMDAAMFKALASSEPVSARLPYGEPFTVTRYAKLMFNCNELPRDVEQTDAFFRRFLLVPFDVTIPEAEQDKGLSGKIIGSELSGVFNWVLAGLQRLLAQERFTDSPAVRNALDQYRRRSDSVLGFLEDQALKPSTTESKPLKDLYVSYISHCKDTGSHPCGQNTFSERLRNSGFTMVRRRQGRVIMAESDHGNEDVF